MFSSVVNSRELDLSILNHIICNPEFIEFNSKTLKEYPFEYPPAREIYTVLFAAIKLHKKAPTLIELSSIVDKHQRKLNRTELEREHIQNEIAYLYKINSTPLSGDFISNFVITKKAQDLGNKLLHMEPEEFKKEAPKLRYELDSLTVSPTKDDLGIFVFSEGGIDYLLGAMEEVYTSSYVPTGWEKYDRKLLGGMRPGELFMYMSPPGKCKTALMINLTHNVAVVEGKRTVYIILDNQDYEMGERMFARLTLNEITGKMGDKELYKTRIKQQTRGGLEHKLILKKWPPKRFSPSDVSNYLRRLSDYLYNLDIAAGVANDKAGKIDLIIIDYLEKLLPNRAKDMYRLELEANCEELVNMGHDFHCPVVTPSQGSKDAAKCDNAQITMAAEAYCKLNPVAHAAIFSQSDAERLYKPFMQFRLNIGKSRRPETDYTCFFYFDTLRQLIWEQERDPQAMVSTTSTELFHSGVFGDHALMAPDVNVEATESWVKEYSPAQKEAEYLDRKCPEEVSC